MADQNLLTILIAVTALAALIQTVVLAVFYLLAVRLGRQAGRVIDASRSAIDPLERTVRNLRAVSEQFSEVAATIKDRLRPLEDWLRRRAA
jgi:hypothetical protein